MASFDKTQAPLRRSAHALRHALLGMTLAASAGWSALALADKAGAPREQPPQGLAAIRTQIERSKSPAELSTQLQRLRDAFIAADARERDTFYATGRHIQDKRLPAGIQRRHQQALQAWRQQSEATLEEFVPLLAEKRPAEARRRVDALLQRLERRPSLLGAPAIRHELPGQPRLKAPRAPRRTLREYTATQDTLLVADNSAASILLAAAAVGLPTAEHLAQTEDAPFTDAIRAQAAELHGQPVEIVNWVRNHIEFVPGYGSVQGAGQTLLNRRGNAADTSSLLLALLRVSGIPARYVVGTVEMDAAAAQNWLGDLPTPQAAIALLQQAGVPAEPVVVAGRISALRFEHVWVEAFVDFEPSRGARNRVPDTWVPMDASFKDVLYTPGIDIARDLRFDAESFIQRLAGASQRDPQTGAVSGIDTAAIGQQLLAYRDQVSRFLASVNPDARVADVLGTQTLVERHPDVLAAALPYRIAASEAPALALPERLRWKLRLSLYASSADLATQRSTVALERSLPQLDGRRVALSFIPATTDDATALASYLPQPHADGSPVQPSEFPEDLPGYLIEMKAQLLIGDDALYTGGNLTLGTPVLLRTEIWDPGQQAWGPAGDRVADVGEYHALSVNGQGMGLPRMQAAAAGLDRLRTTLGARQYGSLTRDALTGSLLEEAGLSYFALADANDRLFARIARAVSARQPSLLRAYVDAQTTYAYGVPTHVRFPAVALQLEQLNTAVVTREVDAEGKPVGYAAFRRAALERASAYGHLSLERLFAGGAPQGASAVKALAQSVVAGTPIYRLGADNLDAALARIDLPADDKQLLRDNVGNGRSGTVSESPVTIAGWSGSGLVISDDASGAGDYRLTGGDAGRLQSGNLAWLALGSPAQAAGGALPVLDAARGVQQGIEVLLGDSSGVRWSEYAAQQDIVGALMLGFVSGAAGGTAADQAILVATANAATGTADLDEPVNQAPVFTTHPVTQARAGKVYHYSASAADPEGDPVQYRITRAPGGVSVSASGHVSWDRPVAGDWVITLRADDGHAWREQTWSLHVDEAAAALDASLSVSPELAEPGTPVTLSVASSGGSGTVTRTLTVNGTPVAIPANGVLQQPAPQTPGVYRIALQVSDDSTTLHREALLRVRSADDSAAPVAEITSPEADAEVSGRIPIRGSASDDHFAWYQLLWRPLGAGDDAWREILTRTTPVANGVLGSFDPTTLDNGLYQLALVAADTGGRQTTALVSIEVYGEQKLGQFSISFVDLSLEAAGIPIQVTRTYDTRRKADKLDFGHGWSVDYQSLRLRQNMTLGLQWNVETPPGQFNVCLRPVGKRRIAITLPDGKVERFSARNATECSFGQPPPVNILFDPAPGTTGSLTLVNVPNVKAQGGVLYDMDNLETWNPQEFKLKTQEGLEYYLREGVGIERVKDAFGNTLDYTANGLIHSGGQTIHFDRDAQGRITAVTDLAGKKIQYGYSAQGDLQSVTDRNAQTTRFKYDRSHGLTDLIDPRGITVARQIYDEQGRLIATIDADGQRSDIVFQPDDNRQVVKNRRGFETAYLYDSEGNVLEKTDALGHKTAYEYDDVGNETKVTDAHGKSVTRSFNAGNKVVTETNALNQATTNDWTLDNGSQRWQLLSTTDARGNVSTNTYSVITAELTLISEPLGRSTRIFQNGKGELYGLNLSGNLTQYGYNAQSQKTSETDPLGRVTNLELDANGQEIARSQTRTKADGSTSTVKTSRKLDAEGRVTEETGPTGLKTTTTYNTAGKVESQTDARGKVTRYEYDSLARLSKTIYPDGGTETVAYDAEGNEVEKTDRAGRTIKLEYDALNRLIKTVHPDGSTEETVYDNVGRVHQQKDSLGHSLTNGYDAAGRLTSVTDALGQATTYGYDANGNRTRVTDASLKTAAFEYDALNRVTKVTLPDGTYTQTTWTTAGQKETETDASGRTSRFGYDAKSQLITVTQNDGTQDLITRYGYDELGNKISQQDAEGRVTRWEYNDLSQVTARVLPEGERETFGYDTNGNRTWHKDFNGRTHTFAYDDLNREIERKYADGARVKTTYTASGQISTQTDARGVTKYQYDARDRLTRVESPEGVIRYQYDQNGNRTLLSTKHQNVQYGFDELNRLQSVTDTQGKQTTYQYNARSQKTRVSLPNGTSSYWEYDDNGRITEVRHEKTATGAILGAYRYTLAANGQRMRLAERDNEGATRTADYEYDGLNRLTKESVTDHRDAAKSYVTAWVYDKVGNRLSQSKTKGGQVEVTSYTYDDNDRLLTEVRTLDGSNQYSTVYSYDANGNTTKKIVTAGGQTDIHVYGWNADNRLTKYSVNGVQKASYQYEPEGIRTSKNDTFYLVDHSQFYAEVLEEGVGASADPEMIYLRGDALLSQDGRGQSNYYHVDGVGSTRLLTEENGEVGNAYNYEAYGEREDSAEGVQNEYLFSGAQYDNALKMYYLRERYLLPAVGRFLILDPHKGNSLSPVTLHKYIYANNSPQFFVDPSGRESVGSLLTAMNVGANLGRIALPVVRAVAIACAAQVVTTTVIGTAGVPLTGVSGPCVGNQMRVQLQQGTSNDVVSDVQMNLPVTGVTTAQVNIGLRKLYYERDQAKWWTQELDKWLYQSIVSLSIKVGRVPPTGVSVVGNIFRQEIYHRGREYRVDVENLRGHNLRR
ncbi:hypothetical protein D0B54_21885 [Solimonas sp. K1W22B-7]|uniref:transglutaminase domain-containing protein n=1 Tax=Solimonas sp. K1W22B-7 TaxID=2303331 RepID=UPI000E33570E|nr:transglutaminase domain-containing protein [Solimonas sp. K1W22B-7]AXQ31164.1 hypothetical protein D0B54_21885 [Solimonas sp. K1W22B-7]